MSDAPAVVLTRVVQTSIACPSQWDAWDADGNYYYLRFRHGCGDMRQYTTPDWVDAPYEPDYDSSVPALLQNPAFVRTVASFEREIPGDPGWVYDGDISLEEFAKLAGITLALAQYTNFGNHLRDRLVQEGMVFLLEDPGSGKEEQA